MVLKTVFIRFYKSFNFDYLRKYHAKATHQDWEIVDGRWFPFVRIPVDPKVTTVVGANESGKSHLLSAIEKGIMGSGIEREDFCRYSEFFTVEEGKLKWPDFGFEWSELTEADRGHVKAACGMSGLTPFDRFLLFRTDREKLTIYIPGEGGYSKHAVEPSALSSLPKALPHVFRIASDIALPESVPIKWLAEDSSTTTNRIESLDRSERFGAVESLGSMLSHPEWFASQQTFTQSADAMFPTMAWIATLTAKVKKTEAKAAQLELARKLIRKVARIDPLALMELYNALRDGKEGHANGIIQKINDSLQKSLNFPHWWVQDRDFQLIVSPREFDLVLTIRDRTGTEYSFSERSSGMKYFLSYYVQYRAHEPHSGGPEILLMDEPDAYLSSQAQQDLLKIFEAFSNPTDGKRPVQVIYVTHSPFLIDKNHAERIRVLEKGVGEEGTRVVNDAAKNHYEPLRSAFGAFVGETTFIGNCNLMVEGQADQILIAGASTFLRSQKVSSLETIDLNHVTIVPAGSASHIPYMVYLARGRDVEQPAVIVLLDSDEGGNDAKKSLKRGGANRKQLLKANYVLQIGDLAGEPGIRVSNGMTLVEIEDLIPLPICVEAARQYARDICMCENDVAGRITEDLVRSKLPETRAVFDALKQCIKELPGEGMHIEKVGFSRLVLEAISRRLKSPGSTPASEGNPLSDFQANMKVLFRQLNKIRREAERELTTDRVSGRVDRAKKAFLQDHPTGVRRDEALVLLEDMQAALDDSIESDEVRIAIQAIRRDFQLESDMTEPVNDYAKFREKLELVKYAGKLATQALTIEEQQRSPNADLESGKAPPVDPTVDPSKAPPATTASQKE